MITVLRYCNIRHIPKPNIICIRNSNSKQTDKNDCGIDSKVKKEDSVTETKELPEEPTTCCMSGCNNCVWIDYADKLSEYYGDGGEQAIREINENISDMNLRAFLLFQLRMRAKYG